MHRKNSATILAAVLGMIVLIAMTIMIVRRQGNLAWDDADYLRRGLRIANRAAASPIPPIKAFGDLLRERPKPPLLVAWIASSTTIIGRHSIEPLIIGGSVGPYALLLLGVVLISRRHFGRHAPLAAILATIASPLGLSFGAKVMVETFLGLTILLTLHFAALVLERPSTRRSFALGVAIGLAMLTKLTVALLLPGPALIFAILFARRFGSGRALGKVIAVSFAGIFLVAGPWYIENGRAAVEFARFSSRYQIEAEGRNDRVDSISRIASIGSQVIGWPNLAVLSLAAISLVRSQAKPSSSSERPDFVSLATAGITAGTIGLLVPSYFDPRFLAPIWPAFAVVLGGLVTNQQDRRGKGLTFAVLLIGSLWSFVELASEPGTTTYWAARTLIDEMVASHGVKTIGNIGDTGDWNVCKTGMINETRPHPEDCFVLHDLSRIAPEALSARLAKLDAVIVLKDSEALADINHIAPGLNRARTAIGSAIEQSGRFRRIETRKIARLPELIVYVRK